MATVSLLTSLQTFDKLHEIADSGAKTVKVDVEVLERLLIDHSNMYKALKGVSSVKVEEPKR